MGLLVLGTLAALVVSGNFLLDAIEGMLMIGAQRFSNIEEEPRLVMYADALRQINLHPLLGLGLGAELDRFGHRVHNLFLAAWYEGGLILFFASLAMYFSLIRSIWKCGRAAYKLDPSVQDRLLLRAGGILALAILPLFRPLVSGDGGAFTLVEWFCIAFVLAETANVREASRAAAV